MLYLLFISVIADMLQIDSECNSDPLCLQYSQSLEATKYPTADRIYRSLTAIDPSNPNLIFDSSGRVLLTSATVISYYPYSEGESFQLYKESWFTAYPDLKNACRAYGTSNKLLRLNQQLGLPPNKVITGVVEIFVNPQDIFRPCPDPEINDHECVLKINVKNKDSADKMVPWFCPKDNKKIIQVSGKWSKVDRDHFVWMCNNWRYSYLNDGVYKNYPWTGLGYTYDWGSDSGIGLSEFVVPKNTTVYFKSKATLDEYCS